MLRMLTRGRTPHIPFDAWVACNIRLVIYHEHEPTQSLKRDSKTIRESLRKLMFAICKFENFRGSAREFVV